ncbi:MAG: hypothetical protein COB50_01800 [Thiotrichales bacterium]|nr:MAG: hypothetical protein COB50_01800 [Thiotrichales bacterium]
MCLKKFLHSFNTFFVVALFVGATVLPNDVFAGAWVQKKGHWILISNFKWYESCRFWDKNHNTHSTSDCYRKFELNPYFEYGATDNLTLGVSAFLRRIKQGAMSTSFSPGDLELLARYKVWQKGSDIFSIQSMFNIPMRHPDFSHLQSPNSTISNGQYAFEGRLLYSTSGHHKHSKFYWYANFELGYRKNFNHAADRVNFEWTVGVSDATYKWIIELKQKNIIGMRNATKTYAPDYDLYSVSPSIIHWVTKHLAVQLGWDHDFYGRNIGQGNAVFVAIWLKS